MARSFILNPLVMTYLYLELFVLSLERILELVSQSHSLRTLISFARPVRLLCST